MEPVQQFEQEHSGSVGDDLFDISPFHSHTIVMQSI